MDTYEAIEKRRTVRTFRQGVSEDQLRKLLLAGANAPSGSNVQPWEFIIIDDPKTIDQIAEHKYQQSLEMVRHYVNLASSHIAIQHQKYSPLDRLNLKK